MCVLGVDVASGVAANNPYTCLKKSVSAVTESSTCVSDKATTTQFDNM